MATLPILLRPTHNQLKISCPSQTDLSDRRELVHELMNQLTVVDLSASQLRFTVSPIALSALERAVENALRVAKLLAVALSSESKPASEVLSHRS
jgi:hypothetical protein